MSIIDHPARQPIPSAAVTRVLRTFDRDQLEGFVAIAIDLMDFADGDCDQETGNDLEDDFVLSPCALGFDEGRGPGCPISDQDAAAWLEWHTRGRHKLERGRSEPTGRGCYGNQLLEDDEDDDPGGGNVKDDGEAIDEREPDIEGAADFGIDQNAPIGADNPVMA